MFSPPLGGGRRMSLGIGDARRQSLQGIGDARRLSIGSKGGADVGTEVTRRNSHRQSWSRTMSMGALVAPQQLEDLVTSAARRRNSLSAALESVDSFPVNHRRESVGEIVGADQTAMRRPSA